MRTEQVVSIFDTQGPRSRHRVTVAMDKYKASVDQFSPGPDDDATSVAQSIQSDFSDLVAIFDRQLNGFEDSDSTVRSHIIEARSAAVRGLQLSRKLMEILGAST